MSAALAAAFAAPGLAIGSFLNVVASRLPLRRSLGHPAVGVYELRDRDRAARQHPRALVPSTARPLPDCGRASRSAIRRSSFSPARSSRAVLFASGGAPTRSRRRLLRRPGRDLRDRPRAPDRPEQNRPAGGSRRARRRSTFVEPSLEWPLAALGASAFLFVAALAYPRGMGMGDVKLALLLGALLGRLRHGRADGRLASRPSSRRSFCSQ